MKGLSNFDKWTLTKFSYDVENQVRNKHKWSYISDLAFLLIYSVLSKKYIMIFRNTGKNRYVI